MKLARNAVTFRAQPLWLAGVQNSARRALTQKREAGVTAAASRLTHRASLGAIPLPGPRLGHARAGGTYLENVSRCLARMITVLALKLCIGRTLSADDL
jgi:hypothetical protein